MVLQRLRIARDHLQKLGDRRDAVAILRRLCGRDAMHLQQLPQLLLLCRLPLRVPQATPSYRMTTTALVADLRGCARGGYRHEERRTRRQPWRN